MWLIFLELGICLENFYAFVKLSFKILTIYIEITKNIFGIIKKIPWVGFSKYLVIIIES